MDDGQTTKSERKIHTPSAFARKNLIFAQETGKLKSIKPHSCVRENLDSYLLFIVLEGKGKVETGGKESYLCTQNVSRERPMCMGSAKSPPA